MASLVEGDLKAPFQKLQHRDVGEGVSPFLGLLHFILDPHLIMLSIKQGGIKYHFSVFGMTRPGSEPRSSGPLANNILIRLMTQYIYIYKNIYIKRLRYIYI